ncbi:DUF998 domain-containing protein [Propioniciclava coleopterorum]|uniref:DUF998 domain-containing protein n=1 Tax=Propioniciclava coleopterorum TaxID=2714937 RepID=A0A6G7YA48_9ACTN|nr:DUF998 domain-containing protein [Propioniciclava coleopterorum]
MDARGNGAAAGVIGPLVFVGVFLIEGALRPGYDAAADFVSALSLGPRGWVQIASFLLTGACLILFAAWLRATFPSGPSSIAGPLLLGLIGAGLFASGPLVMDPAGTPLDAATWHGMAHNILGALVFVLMPVAMFVWLRRIRREPRLGASGAPRCSWPSSPWSRTWCSRWRARCRRGPRRRRPGRARCSARCWSRSWCGWRCSARCCWAPRGAAPRARRLPGRARVARAALRGCRPRTGRPAGRRTPGSGARCGNRPLRRGGSGRRAAAPWCPRGGRSARG